MRYIILLLGFAFGLYFIIADRLKIANFEEGEKIIKKGDKESAIYLIKSGNVSVCYKGNEIKTV